MKVKPDGKTMTKVFCVPSQDKEILEEISDVANNRSYGWTVQRVLLDERLSENGKLYGIFCLGAAFERGN